jgi:hypothetical protein
MTAHARWNAHTQTSLVMGVRDHDPNDLAARPRHTWVTSPVAQHGLPLIAKLQLDIRYWEDLLDFLQLNLGLLESDAAPFPRGRAPMIADGTAGGVGPQFEHTGYETEQGIPRQTRLRRPTVLC